MLGQLLLRPLFFQRHRPCFRSYLCRVQIGVLRPVFVYQSGPCQRCNSFYIKSTRRKDRLIQKLLLCIVNPFYRWIRKFEYLVCDGVTF